MTPIEDDPAPAKVTPLNRYALAKLILNELCEVAKKWMTVDPEHKRLAMPLVLVPEASAPRRGLGRKTQPIPVVKQVWFAAASLEAGTESMAFVIGTDGTPYCSYFEAGVGSRSIELTREFLEDRDDTTLAHILAEVRNKRETLELQMPLED